LQARPTFRSAVILDHLLLPSFDIANNVFQAGRRCIDFIALGISSIVRRNLGYTPGLAILAKSHQLCVRPLRHHDALVFCELLNTIAPLAGSMNAAIAVDAPLGDEVDLRLPWV
jgi:hypothetical protein